MMKRVTACAASAVCAGAFGQSVMRPVVFDGDVANGYPGSTIDLTFSDQSMTNSLPQVAADGTVTFRARILPSAGGQMSVNDSWWLTREGSYQLAVYGGGPPGLLQAPTGQFGRFYLPPSTPAVPGGGRMVIDRSGVRFFEWLDMRWVAGLGAGGWATTLNGAPWTFTTIDRTNVVMPRPDLVAFATRLPPTAGAAGQVSGFAAGWQGVYATLLTTGEPVPGSPGQTLLVPESVDSSDSSLGRSLRLNASGQWAARVGVTGTGVTGLNNVAICRGTLGGGAPTILMRAGDAAPGWPDELHATVLQLSRPSINGLGHVAFIARVAPFSSPGSNTFALYADRGAGLELLARTGAVVQPSTPGGQPTLLQGTVVTTGAAPGLLVPPVIGEDGTVAFEATVTQGDAALAYSDGQVYEITRRDRALPRTGGRVVVRPFITGAGTDGATGIAIAANGDVVLSVPASGTYDPRLTNVGLQTPAVISWRAGRGTRVIACQGMVLDCAPGMHNRIISGGLLGDGNNHDGVPTAVGHGNDAALQLNITRLVNDTFASLQAVVVADLDTFACGIADIGGPGASPRADGVLDNNDFIVLIDRFFAGDLRADFGRVGGVPGFDDRLDTNDLVAFVDLFFAGCP